MPATSRDNLGECWATARRRAWDSGQELDDAPNEARRAGARSVVLSREGRVVAAGLLADVLTADNLSATFGTPLRLEQTEGRWFARAAPTAR